jgi:catalase
MSDPGRYSFANLTKPSSLVRLAGIGAVLVVAAGAFAATAGWFSSGRLDQARMIDRFEAVNGQHPGFRRNHAKGVCLTGMFEGNGAGTRLSTASVFERQRVPVIGRFALGGGVPTMPDSPGAVRSLALEFQLAGGQRWRTGMNGMPVFPVKDAQGFYELLTASGPDPRTGKPDPAALPAFLARHPESARALAQIRQGSGASSSFADTTYNSLNAFQFTDAAGTVRPVRWSMVPLDTASAPAPATASDPNYLFDALIARVARAPAHWRLVLTVGQPGDPTGDATVAWPADREHVDVGLLIVTALQGEDGGACDDVNFDPLVLPSGIAASDDPLLSARSAAYAQSFTRREGEAKPPSVVRLQREK